MRFWARPAPTATSEPATDIATVTDAESLNHHSLFTRLTRRCRVVRAEAATSPEGLAARTRDLYKSFTKLSIWGDAKESADGQTAPGRDSSGIGTESMNAVAAGAERDLASLEGVAAGSSGSEALEDPTSSALTLPSLFNPPAPPSGALQFENYGRECFQLMSLQTFEGFMLDATKAVNKNLAVNHTVSLTSSAKEGVAKYQFSPSLTTEDGSFVLMPRFYSDGTVATRIFSKVTDNIEAKLTAHSHLKDEQKNLWELSVDLNRPAWAVSWKTGWQGTLLYSGTFSQVLSPILQMGGELTYLTGSGASVGSAGFRYSEGKNVLSGLVSRAPDFKTGSSDSIHTYKLQFHRKISDRLSLGAELEAAPSSGTSSLKFGYEHLFKQARIQGLLDTSGKLAMTLLDASGFGLSGTADVRRNQYKVGVLFQIMPQQQQQQQQQEQLAGHQKLPE